ncbi:vitamin B12 ABC transporter permease BtuC, partial [Vibrio genomosp. F10 str. 9ZD137]
MDFNQLLQKKHRRWMRYSFLLFTLLLVSSAVYLLVGELTISPFEPISSLEYQLLYQLRLPRLLA